ncbi:hypothetical protein ACXIVK_31745 [Paraburkholderia caledonica]
MAHLIDSMARDARSLPVLSKIVGIQIVFMTLADRLNFGKPTQEFLWFPEWALFFSTEAIANFMRGA